MIEVSQHWPFIVGSIGTTGAVIGAWIIRVENRFTSTDAHLKNQDCQLENMDKKLDKLIDLHLKK